MKLCPLPRLVVLAVVLLQASPAMAQTPAEPGDWPQWRGPNRDGISTDTGLLKQWPEEGPEVVWQVDGVGVSYSSIAIKAGRIFTQGDLNGVEHIICLSVKDGSVLWAVQPEPVVEMLNERVAKEFKNADQDGNGKVDEVEAWKRFGSNFTNYDRTTEDDRRDVAVARVGRLLAALDANQDGKLTYDEAGEVLRDEFSRFDAADRDVDADELAATRTQKLFAAIDADGDGKISRDESRGTQLSRPFNQADKRDPETKKGGWAAYHRRGARIPR